MRCSLQMKSRRDSAGLESISHLCVSLPLLHYRIIVGNVIFDKSPFSKGIDSCSVNFRMLCTHHSNVRPDILVLGKALSGGMYPVCFDFQLSTVIYWPALELFIFRIWIVVFSQGVGGFGGWRDNAKDKAGPTRLDVRWKSSRLQDRNGSSSGTCLYVIFNQNLYFSNTAPSPPPWQRLYFLIGVFSRYCKTKNWPKTLLKWARYWWVSYIRYPRTLWVWSEAKDFSVLSLYIQVGIEYCLLLSLQSPMSSVSFKFKCSVRNFHPNYPWCICFWAQLSTKKGKDEYSLFITAYCIIIILSPC